MATKLTSEQMDIVKGMVDFGKIFADQIMHIMKNHGLDKVPGCSLSIRVDPEFELTTETVVFGTEYMDTGVLRLTKGKFDKRFCPLGKNDPDIEKVCMTEE